MRKCNLTTGRVFYVYSSSLGSVEEVILYAFLHIKFLIMSFSSTEEIINYINSDVLSVVYSETNTTLLGYLMTNLLI